MTGKKMWYLVSLIALAMLPLAGCSGGGASPITEKGTNLTVSGTTASSSTSKSVAATTTAIGTVQVFNTYSTATKAALGSADIQSDGSFSNLSFTLPATKSVVVFKATFTDTTKSTLRYVLPVDLTNPPTGLTSNNVTIAINTASTTIAANVATALGLTGLLGDVTLHTDVTFASLSALVTKYGGQVLAYSSNGITLTGSASSNSALLPAQDIAALDTTAAKELKLTGTVTAVSIPDNGKPVVSFQVTNAQGKGVKGLPKATIALGLLKLVPGVGTKTAPAADGGVDTWISYMQTTASGTPSTEKATVTGGVFVDNGDGSYSYTFNQNVKTALKPASGFNSTIEVTSVINK